MQMHIYSNRTTNACLPLTGRQIHVYCNRMTDAKERILYCERIQICYPHTIYLMWIINNKCVKMLHILGPRFIRQPYNCCCVAPTSIAKRKYCIIECFGNGTISFFPWVHSICLIPLSGQQFSPDKAPFEFHSLPIINNCISPVATATVKKFICKSTSNTVYNH